ncbi:MAG TPA: hypothetical protein VIS75_03455, partial [Chitinophagaceae bacterium]
MKKVLSLSLGLIFIGNFLFAQNFTAVASGAWNSNTTWGTAVGVYPGAAAGTLVVTIPTGFAVTLGVTPAFPIGDLAIAVGNGNNSLTVSAGTLTVTGGILITGAVTGGGGVTKSLIMSGTGVVSAASLTLTPGNADDKLATVQFNGGGTINISGDVTMPVDPALDQRTQIIFNGGGTLSVTGNTVGGQISVIGAAATSTLNITGSASTVGNLIMNGATTSILDLNGNLTVLGTLTLTAGKIDIGPNLLVLSNAVPATQLAGGSATSYVYTTSSAGRLVRQNLAAATAYTFPVGTPTDYLPVIVNTAAGTSSFAVSAYSPAASNAAVGGPAFSASILLRIVNAMWIIDRPVGAGTSTLTLGWVAGLEGATFAALPNTSIGISRHTGLAWSAAIQTAGDNTANTVTANFTAFGVFGVADIGVALPVKFGAIKAYEKLNGIQLDWKVYSENKVKSYEIERSGDGRSYTTVGSLPALYNNKAEGDYGFFDASPLAGTSYYRIKNNDLDGKSAYSIVVRVNRNKAIMGLSLYPNPVLNRIVTLQGSDLGRGNYKINIFGANGQEIFKQLIKHN